GFAALNSLNENEWNILIKYYLNIKCDLETASGYLSMRNINMLMNLYKQFARRSKMKEERLKLALADLLLDLKEVEEKLGIKLGPKNLIQEKYENVINNFLISYLMQEDEDAKRYLVEAATIRKCIG
ncbi:MAG: phosphoenolpyruvate carboxylase, partial [Nitrososphaeria archaeon]|nr:phosphoenolpyruvate carboxylase [Nitrososphaeria archaeon]